MRNNSYEHTFYKTFSGTDSLAFMLLPNCKPILLGSLTTISYSMYRDKKPVTLIGKTSVEGYTRGVRVVAGSLIFTLINQHITKDLVDQVPYLNEHKKVKADELPIFDIMVISANEYGASSKMMIYGIDITDDAQVLSIEDLFTENTFNFVARDLDEFTADKGTIIKAKNKGRARVDTVTPYSFDIDGYNDMVGKLLKSVNDGYIHPIQSELVKLGELSEVTGAFDDKTLQAVKSVQRKNNITPTGIIDDATYNAIMNSGNKYSEIIKIKSPSGAYIYDNKNKTRINGIINHNSSFTGVKDGDFYRIYNNGVEGYVSKSDVKMNKGYKVSLTTPQGQVKGNIRNYKDIGIEINPNSDMSIKLSAISIYDEGVDCFSKFIKASSGEISNISLSNLTDAFIYNLSMKSKPQKIFFIIMSQDSFIYKWEVVCDE